MLIFRCFRKTAKSDYYVLRVRLFFRPAAWNNSAPTGRILMKLNIWDFFLKFVEKIQVSLKSDKNNGYFTQRRFHIYNNISLNSC